MSYKAVHARLKYKLGSARNMECIDCEDMARDWAYQGGAPDERRDPIIGALYSDDLTYYAPMCRPCHREMDLRKEFCPRGHAMTPENTIHDSRRKCRKCVNKRYRDRYWGN